MVFHFVKIKNVIPFAGGIVLCLLVIGGLQLVHKGTLRYCLLPVTGLYASILAAGALILRFFCPRRWRFFFKCTVIILVCISVGKLLHLNPYRALTADFSALIQKESGTASAPLILTFDKRAEQYRYYSALPVVAADHRIGSPNSVLETWLSALSWNHDRVYVIWEMAVSQNYVPPEPSSPFFPGCGEWEKMAESYTTRKRNKKRYLYRYTFSDKIREKLNKIPQDFSVENYSSGNMEHAEVISGYYSQTLGKTRGIPFFQKQNRAYPQGIDLWLDGYWQPQCNAEIYLTGENVIAGKNSLCFSADKPILWVMRTWFPVQDAIVSFDACCTSKTMFRLVVQGRYNGHFLHKGVPHQEYFCGTGKTTHYVLPLTSDFLKPAEEIRIGIRLECGRCILDNLSLKTRSAKKQVNLP